MSLKTMPILFLNMGGEMVYILEQRLNAQSVKQDKATRVMTDIVGTMFSRKFIEEIFKPQNLYSRKGMRALFEKLAHASIMRLNSTSMDKLYDLMTMACKYQLQMCVSPRDILLVTLNHLDGIRKIVQGVANVQNQIDYAFSLIEQHYLGMSPYELHLLRSTLLAFYQDARVKVSLLLREKKQKDDGRFVIAIKGGKVPYGGSIPGTLRYYAKGQQTNTATFNSGGSYAETVAEGSLAKAAKKGERVIDLGVNIYKNTAVETQGGVGSVAAGTATKPTAKAATGNGASQSTSKSSSSDAEAKDELKLLSKLLTGGKDTKSKAEGKESKLILSLFDNPEDEDEFLKAAVEANEETANVIKIDASKRDKRDMNKMLGEMNVAGKEKKKKKAKGDELLELMDSAAEKPE